MRLLQEDERRAEKMRTSAFTLSWEKPIFTTALGRRRLRILNSVLLATARAGGRGHVNGGEAENVSVSVHQQHVPLRLAAAAQLRRRTQTDRQTKSRERTILRLSILHGFGGQDERASWEDTDGADLEARIGEIAVEIVVTAELQHREQCVRLHEWRIERKAQLEEQRRRQRAEAERKERSRQAALAKDRIERLLSQAASLTHANAIRAYVEAVCSDSRIPSIDPNALTRWRNWALEQADRIDPVLTRAFLTEMEPVPPAAEIASDPAGVGVSGVA